MYGPHDNGHGGAPRASFVSFFVGCVQWTSVPSLADFTSTLSRCCQVRCLQALQRLYLTMRPCAVLAYFRHRGQDERSPHRERSELLPEVCALRYAVLDWAIGFAAVATGCTYGATTIPITPTQMRSPKRSLVAGVRMRAQCARVSAGTEMRVYMCSVRVHSMYAC